MFTISNKLQHKYPKKSNQSSFKLNDSENNPIPLPEDQLAAVHSHYSTFFNTATPQNPHQPIHTPYPNGQLPSPISLSELEQALASLANGKAAGPLLLQLLCNLLNNIFESNEPLELITTGFLIPFNKAKKDPKVTNLRPITLLPLIRKILSLIALQRGRVPLQTYIGHRQSASTNRSCADILWTFRYYQASLKHLTRWTGPYCWKSSSISSTPPLIESSIISSPTVSSR